MNTRRPSTTTALSSEDKATTWPGKIRMNRSTDSARASSAVAAPGSLSSISASELMLRAPSHSRSGWAGGGGSSALQAPRTSRAASAAVPPAARLVLHPLIRPFCSRSNSPPRSRPTPCGYCAPGTQYPHEVRLRWGTRRVGLGQIGWGWAQVRPDQPSRRIALPSASRARPIQRSSPGVSERRAITFCIGVSSSDTIASRAA